ncbi:recombinase family protein [Perlucidibaca aquatica]|uniref:recombinase family protein n=1 Tax=Perlucidibaca aquatica TaxID=1852776 RepID=UPI00083A2E30|nr:recombinase family protein [Perlucidibaca aquatica]
MQTVFYARVSTTDQTIEHQQRQAEDAGHRFDRVFMDDGESGINKKLADRPAGKEMMGYLRAGDSLVVRWIDRLGRNYEDVTSNIRELLERGVIIKTIINGMVFDGSTTDPMQKAVRDALVAFMSAMAQAQGEATKIAQRAGIEHAKAFEGEAKYKGRKPAYNRAQLATVRDGLGHGMRAMELAKQTGLSRSTIYRIKDDYIAAEKALATWGK